MVATLQNDIRTRIEGILRRGFGRVEEALMASGLLDSLRTVEFVLLLEAEFRISMDQLTVDDLATIDALSRRIDTLTRARTARSAT